MKRNSVFVAILTILLSGFSLPAHSETGLGGGANFQAGAVFPFIAGINSSIRTGFFVQNLGKDSAILEFSDTGVEGIELEPVKTGEIRLAGKKATDVLFDIKVSDFVPPGDYPMILTLEQTNIPAAQPGQIAYAPAISGSVVVRVSGANATVIIEPINSDDQSPAVGDITLRYLPKNGSPVEIARKTGKRLEKRVIEGRYQAEFTIEGLVQEQVNFKVKNGETKTVRIEIQGVQFILAVAKRQVEDGGQLVAAELAVAVRNQLKRLSGPIDFTVEVSKNGELVEETKISSLAELPIGNTEQKTSYSPPGGFTAGTWVFNFVVSGPGFKVESFEDPVIQIDPSPIWIILLLLLALLIGLFFYLWKKKLTERQKVRIKQRTSRLLQTTSKALKRSYQATLMFLATVLSVIVKWSRVVGRWLVIRFKALQEQKSAKAAHEKINQTAQAPAVLVEPRPLGTDIQPLEQLPPGSNHKTN